MKLVAPPSASGLGSVYRDNAIMDSARQSIDGYAQRLATLQPLSLTETHLDMSDNSFTEPVRRVVLWTTTETEQWLSEDPRHIISAYTQTPSEFSGLYGRTQSKKLKSPLTMGPYPLPITQFDFKGCSLYRDAFSWEEPNLVPHLGRGFGGRRQAPDLEGKMVERQSGTSPEGGLLFQEAVTEFFNTMYLSQFTTPENKFLVKYPLALGLYPDLSYLGLPVGFIIFGTPSALAQRNADNRKELPTAMGRALAWCHNQGLLHYWLHPENITITSDKHIGIHDLDGAWNAFYHDLTPLQFMAGRQKDLTYSGGKIMGTIFPGIPSRLMAKIARSGLDTLDKPFEAFMRAYRKEYQSTDEHLFSDKAKLPNPFSTQGTPLVPEALLLEAVARIDDSSDQSCPFERAHKPFTVINWFFSLCGYDDVLNENTQVENAAFFKGHPDRIQAAHQIMKWFLRSDSSSI